MPLRREDLRRALESAAFGGLPDQAIPASLDSFDAIDDPSITEDLRAGTWVTSMADGLSRAVGNPAFRDKLRAADICVIRADIMNACALMTEEGPKVIIFTGLLKVMVFMAEFSTMVAIVNRHRERITTTLGMSDGDLNRLGYRAFTLIGHFAGLGSPLLRAFPYLPSAARASEFLNISKVIWFTVAHEMAHIELGHLSGEDQSGGPGAYPALAYDEGSNFLKQNEFDADAYIFETLGPLGCATALSFFLSPLQVFSSLERIIANPGTTHPMAINRLNHLRQLVGNDEDPRNAELVDGVIAEQVWAFGEHGRDRRNRQLLGSYEQAVSALESLRKYARYFGASDPSPDGDHKRNARNWDLFIDHLWDVD